MCGQTPFAGSTDAAEAIHQHLARAPASLLPTYMTAASHPARHAMLTAVNSIILKLLQKQAEDRYQSVDGLLFDLQHVATVLAAEAPMWLDAHASSHASALIDFKIGARDWCGSFRVSRKLYGRDAELQQLSHILDEMHEAGLRGAGRQQAHAAGRQSPSPARTSPTAQAACTIVIIRGLNNIVSSSSSSSSNHSSSLAPLVVIACSFAVCAAVCCVFDRYSRARAPCATSSAVWWFVVAACSRARASARTRTGPPGHRSCSPCASWSSTSSRSMVSSGG